MNGFSEETKKKVHEESFPVDLKNAFDMGVKVGS
jgi:hypothetical protein